MMDGKREDDNPTTGQVRFREGQDWTEVLFDETRLAGRNPARRGSDPKKAGNRVS